MTNEMAVMAIQLADMKDLFGSSEMERLPLVDAELCLQREIKLCQPAGQLLDRLIQITPWRQEEIQVYGKYHLQPRLSAWYGDEDSDYGYSGIHLSALPWTDLLLNIKASVEAIAGAEFNSVLLNYYRDHNDSMGMHSDDESELGEEPVIASLSLGERRNFILRHKYRKDIDSFKLALDSGSLLIMKGETQTWWRHGITRERNFCGPRMNLTFRTIKK